MSQRIFPPSFSYRLLMGLMFPALALHAIWLAIRHRNRRYLRERLGFSAGELTDIWIHAASVGEVNAVLPLLHLLAARHSGTRILFTTATISGATFVKTRLPEVQHRFLPLDRMGGVRRFLAGCRPRCAIIVETELWPNLFAACAEHSIPIVVVNGRISERTLRAPTWLRGVYRESLSRVRTVLARSDEDRRRFIELGAPADVVEVIGNLKFAAAPRADAVSPMELGRPYVLAASTRDGEERLVAEAWKRSGITSHLLIIAPRHPQRLAVIITDLSDHDLVVRSRGEAITAATTIYVADTLGELPQFIAGADLVFMGGSLVPKGGQNLLEPAALGKAVITGPYMENFALEAELLHAESGLVQVRDSEELAQCLRTLLNDESKRRALGENAKRLIDSRRDVVELYADAIDRDCFSAR